MPLQRCQTADGKPGWRWGNAGFCYGYAKGSPGSETAAKRRALEQAVAISHSQARAGKKPDLPT